MIAFWKVSCGGEVKHIILGVNDFYAKTTFEKVKQLVHITDIKIASDAHLRYGRICYFEFLLGVAVSLSDYILKCFALECNFAGFPCQLVLNFLEVNIL